MKYRVIFRGEKKHECSTFWGAVKFCLDNRLVRHGWRLCTNLIKGCEIWCDDRLVRSWEDDRRESGEIKVVEVN